MDIKKQWISVHLYYEEPWENFLVDAVMPFVKNLNNTHLINCYFFIRYWEKGPHIRLRLKIIENTDTESLRKIIFKYFDNYFTKNPSFRKRNNNNELYPNNSIQFIEYMPEIGRYGGNLGICISEKQFEMSSNTVLDIFNDYHEISYENKLAVAIQLHLGFIYSFKLTLQQGADLFKTVSNRMLTHVMKPEKINNGQDFESNKQKVLEKFNSIWESKSDSLTDFHTAIWETLLAKNDFDSNWMNSWVKMMTCIFNELSANKIELFIPEWYDNNVKLCYIYESYIHMTNNRIGITNIDEAYLAYIIYRTINRIITKE